MVTSFDGYNSYLLVVDESTKYTWVYLCTSKEPPIALIEMHLDHFGSKSGFICTDQGGELAGCDDFLTRMALRKFIVEPTGADSPNQNKQVEKYNDILAITVRVLLYGSGLPAHFWSAALLHAVYLHNRRVHKSILMTPFEAWNGYKPDLRSLRVFGSRVCVKRTGKRRSKLDRHDFTGIVVGYTATDENIRYIDVNTRMVKSSHHAIFDEAWYLQPKRPPFAQMLYDVGLEQNEEIIVPTSMFVPLPPFPPLPKAKPSPLPKQTTIVPLPLRLSSPASIYAAAAAKSTLDDDLVIQPSLHKKRLEHEMIMQNDISHKDLEMVTSPHHLTTTLSRRCLICGGTTQQSHQQLESSARKNRLNFFSARCRRVHRQPRSEHGALVYVVLASLRSMALLYQPTMSWLKHCSVSKMLESRNAPFSWLIAPFVMV